MQGGNKTELITRLLDLQPADFKNKPKVQPWKTNKAKALLIKLLSDKESQFNLLSPNDVYESSEWFMQYPKTRFISNMKSLKKALAARDAVARNDNATIETELAALASLNPFQDTLRGYPLWHESDAGQLLEDDIKNNRHKDMFPEEFQRSRLTYDYITKQIGITIKWYTTVVSLLSPDSRHYLHNNNIVSWALYVLHNGKLKKVLRVNQALNENLLCDPHDESDMAIVTMEYGICQSELIR